MTALNQMFTQSELRDSEIQCAASDILLTGCVKATSSIQIAGEDGQYIIVVDENPVHFGARDEDFDYIESVVWVLHNSVN